MAPPPARALGQPQISRLIKERDVTVHERHLVRSLPGRSLILYLLYYTAFQRILDAHVWKRAIRKKLCIDPCFFRIDPGVIGGYWCVSPDFSRIFDHGDFKRRKVMLKPTKKRQSLASNAPATAPASNNGPTVSENLETGNPCCLSPPGYLQPESDFAYRFQQACMYLSDFQPHPLAPVNYVYNQEYGTGSGSAPADWQSLW
ncbi:hypothetical protein FKM82_019851 [Ascaphus truei]